MSTTDLVERVRAAIELERDLADEHHLGQCTRWIVGWRLDPGPCNCYGPAHTRRRCEADLRTVERHQPDPDAPDDWAVHCNYCDAPWPCVEFLDRADAYDIDYAPDSLTRDQLGEIDGHDDDRTGVEMSMRTYPKDAHGNTVFPRKLRRIEWFHGLWYYSYTVGGFEGYRKLFTRQKTAGVTLATWKWSDWHEEHGHLWQRRPGKPTRCVICRCPVLPWHRRWRDRALIRWAIIRGAMWWSR